VRAVLAGQIYVSATIKKDLTTTYVAGGRQSSAPLETLSDRELEILQLLGTGCDVHKIAKALNISPKTVDAHRFNIKEKLKMKSSSEVTRYATNWVNAQC
jgi:DNA-binding NarL/FixJ family response regulator